MLAWDWWDILRELYDFIMKSKKGVRVIFGSLGDPGKGVFGFLGDLGDKGNYWFLIHSIIYIYKGIG